MIAIEANDKTTPIKSPDSGCVYRPGFGDCASRNSSRTMKRESNSDHRSSASMAQGRSDSKESDIPEGIILEMRDTARNDPTSYSFQTSKTAKRGVETRSKPGLENDKR